MTEITVKDIKACKVASTEGKGFEGIKVAFKDTLVFILANGYKFGKLAGILVYGNSPVEVGWDNCVYKACMPVKGRPELASRRQIEVLPAITAACMVHKGPYDQLPEVWNKVYAWLSENGYKPTAVGREAYLNDCDVTPPEEPLTEVQVPVAR
jgi:effector-binding domain-containing protein